MLREGKANPFALYELESDQWEKENRIDEPELAPLVAYLSDRALTIRTTGGVRCTEFAPSDRIVFRWGNWGTMARPQETDLQLTIRGADGGKDFHSNDRGPGLAGGDVRQVDNGEALLLSFDRDVLVESVGIVAGNGVCGGFYQVGDKAPLAIYCIDADIDSKEQHGLLSDLGVLRKGEILRLDSSPHYGVEAAGKWRLQSLTVRKLP